MRRQNDDYPTEYAITQALLTHVPVAGHVVEPCAGEGRMAMVLRQHRSITGLCLNDIRPLSNLDYHEDASCESASFWTHKYDWVVTNPPFSVAFPILFNAYEHARVGVAFLLRLTFLEPTAERGEWLRLHADQMTHLMPFGQPRPSFTADGKTDSVTAAWMVWQKEWSWRALGVEPPFQTVYGWKL